MADIPNKCHFLKVVLKLRPVKRCVSAVASVPNLPNKNWQPRAKI